MSLSNITETALLEMVSDAIPSSLGLSEAQIKAKIARGLSYINAFYADNDLGVYVDTDVFTFYNTGVGDTNVREDSDVDTRWQIVPNVDFQPVKLLSCMLKSILPADIALPADISFVQDIDISVEDAEDINVLVPTANKGAVAYLGGVGLYTVLSLDTSDNTFDNIQSIDCMITYYRQIEIPTYSVEGTKIDLLVKDIGWLINLVLSYCNPSHIDAKVKRGIREHEDNLLY